MTRDSTTLGPSSVVRLDTVSQAHSREPWLPDEALARYFSVTPRTVRRWAVAGMPSRRFGGVRRFRISEAEQWHQKQEDHR
jgi:hypothetical protein